MDMIEATGRRKESVARVRLLPGSGRREINGRPVGEYFPRSTLVEMVEAPFQFAAHMASMDLMATVRGGGLTGQAGALRLGIARALAKSDESLRGPLKKAGYLRRDPRMKERKKYGLAGARKRFQFSKR
jgi:small subunit ribosomal protein S9